MFFLKLGPIVIASAGAWRWRWEQGHGVECNRQKQSLVVDQVSADTGKLPVVMKQSRGRYNKARTVKAVWPT